MTQDSNREAFDALWECIGLSEADTSGGRPPDEDLAAWAVSSVRELRARNDSDIEQAKMRLGILRIKLAAAEEELRELDEPILKELADDHGGYG